MYAALMQSGSPGRELLQPHCCSWHLQQLISPHKSALFCCWYVFWHAMALQRANHASFNSCMMQDLVLLPQAAVKDFLQALLRDASILKVRCCTFCV